ncbi:MAG: phosphatase PAP2 family protein, partial [bacterium]|nr:phosphatase PAP2 family protein [bacterium]
EGARQFRFNDGTSFPSGHAKNVMIAANVLARRIDFLPVQVAAYGLAGTVCLERITSGSHWPSDVYFAAVYGWIISNELVNRHDRKGLTVTPGAPDGSPGISLRFSF